MSARGAAACSLLAACALLASDRPARAHAADPIGVTLREGAGGAVRVEVRSGSAAARAWPIDVVPPPGCALAEPARWACDGPLSGRSFRIDRLAEAGAPVVVRVELADGRTCLDVATPDHPVITIPERSPWRATLRAYLGLGVRHLAAGLDHLLFIAGLFLVARKLGRTVRALTAFTLGHSVTLCASVLGWLSFPAKLGELAIAASLVLLAVRVVRPARAARALSLVSFAMGLVHGLGFAAALSETGLRDVDVPVALLGFNLGIEAAQLALVVALVAAWWIARGLGLAERPRHRSFLGHALGATAAMWCIERLFALVPT